MDVQQPATWYLLPHPTQPGARHQIIVHQSFHGMTPGQLAPFFGTELEAYAVALNVVLELPPPLARRTWQHRLWQVNALVDLHGATVQALHELHVGMAVARDAAEQHHRLSRSVSWTFRTCSYLGDTEVYGAIIADRERSLSVHSNLLHQAYRLSTLYALSLVDPVPDQVAVENLAVGMPHINFTRWHPDAIQDPPPRGSCFYHSPDYRLWLNPTSAAYAAWLQSNNNRLANGISGTR